MAEIPTTSFVQEILICFSPGLTFIFVPLPVALRNKTMKFGYLSSPLALKVGRANLNLHWIGTAWQKRGVCENWHHTQDVTVENKCEYLVFHSSAINMLFLFYFSSIYVFLPSLGSTFCFCNYANLSNVALIQVVYSILSETNNFRGSHSKVPWSPRLLAAMTPNSCCVTTCKWRAGVYNVPHF